MARWRRRPTPGQTVVHSDRGSQCTTWAFGQWLRPTGLLGSMGRVASALDNAMMESFFGTLQLELLDSRTWGTRAELARAIFEWIEGRYNTRRCHTSVGDLSPVDYERRLFPTIDDRCGMISKSEPSEKPDQAQCRCSATSASRIPPMVSTKATGSARPGEVD